LHSIHTHIIEIRNRKGIFSHSFGAGFSCTGWHLDGCHSHMPQSEPLPEYKVAGRRMRYCVGFGATAFISLVAMAVAVLQNVVILLLFRRLFLSGFACDNLLFATKRFYAHI
jgi:hypothetical protein